MPPQKSPDGASGHDTLGSFLMATAKKKDKPLGVAIVRNGGAEDRSGILTLTMHMTSVLTARTPAQDVWRQIMSGSQMSVSIVVLSFVP